MAQITLNSSGVASSGSLLLQTNGTTTQATVDTSGNLGLGVTPSAWSSTWKALQATGGSVVGSTSNIRMAQNWYHDGTSRYVASRPAAMFVADDGAFAWYNAASGTAGNAISFTQAMTLDASGNLGVGTTSPAYKVDARLSGTSSGAVIQVGNTSSGGFGGLGVSDGGAYPVQMWGAAIAFLTGNSSYGSATERARIDSSGYSRWSDTGSYSYSGTAHSVNNSASNDVIRFFNSNATPYGIFVKYTAADPNNASSYVFGAEQNTGVNIYKIYSNGTVAARSDARWKKNIETARNGYLSDLNQLRVVKYNWYNNEDGTAKELGLIAQEVETVFPNMVVTDNVGEENESKSIKTSVLPFMLLKAIQEMKTIIDQQAERITQLQADVAALKG